MGKKKSKTSKQKLSKANSKRSHNGGAKKKFGGIAIVKSSNGASRAPVTFSTPPASAKKRVVPKWNNDTAKRPSRDVPASASASASVGKNVIAHIVSPSSKAERAEFDRQYASMEERECARSKRRQQQRESKQQKQNQAESHFTFEPPSFRLEKTTHELMQEAVVQMEGMEGVGKRTADNSTPVRSNCRWTSFSEDAPPTPELPDVDFGNNRNAFAALQDDDSDDGEWRVSRRQEQPASLPFQLATPSFSFASVPPAPTEADIDPDL